MKKDQINILKDRGIILVSGKDSKEFLQNIVTNDLKKVKETNTIFSGIFTPQGKYLYEFFILKSDDGYLLDCPDEFTEEIITFLSKYKLNSDVLIKNISNKFIVGIISNDKFEEIKKKENKFTQTIIYRSSPIFQDPRSTNLGTRIISNLEKLYLTIKKLSLNIQENNNYFTNAHEAGIPIKKLKNLQNNLFGLEANFEELTAIDFKKGCYIGQENTARMKLRNKIRKKLFALNSESSLEVGSEISFENNSIGKVLISNPYPFGLLDITKIDVTKIKNKEVLVGKHKAKIIL
ncbi:folate-binding protein [Pelagibacteraceae bacterium]|nr:folate-binding protein [Pelagibacteraceae bacterium]